MAHQDESIQDMTWDLIQDYQEGQYMKLYNTSSFKQPCLEDQKNEFNTLKKFYNMGRVKDTLLHDGRDDLDTRDRYSDIKSYK